MPLARAPDPPAAEIGLDALLADGAVVVFAADRPVPESGRLF